MKRKWIDGARVRATAFGVILVTTVSGVAALSGSGAMSAVMVAQATGLPSSSASTSTTTSAASPTAVLRRFSPLYMGGGQRFSQAQALTIAHSFDVIVAKSGMFSAYVSSMKSAKPGLRIVAYMNGAFDQSGNGSKYPSSWYAHDSKGNRIKSVGFNNWLMDPTNSQWSATLAQQCAALKSTSKYDGCFLDTLGLGPLMAGYVTGLPVDPSTHRVFTATAWINAQSSNVARVQSSNPGATVIPNGLGNGSKYFGGPTQPLLAASHMAMAEIWLRVSRNSVNSYPSSTQWKQDVDMLVNAESHGWSALTVTKLWTNASTAQQDAWHRFTVASFLLGAGGHCAYSFSTAQSTTALSATSAYDTLAIGSPTGAYALRNGAYQRTFTAGVVVVNPGNQSVTLPLGRSYRNLSGATVTSETLAAHSGDVLLG